MRKMQLKIWFICAIMSLTGYYLVSCSDDNDGGGDIIDPLEEILDVDKSELLYGVEEETISMKITSNLSWTVSSTANWCEPSVLTGNGDADINIAVTGNNGVNERRGQLIVKGGKKRIVLDVVQLGDEVKTIIYVDGVEIEDNETANIALLDFESKEYLVNIVSNAECNIEFQGNNWLQYRQSMQSGYAAPMNIHYFYDIFSADNSVASSRNASMKISQKMGEYVRTVTIQQKPFSDFLKIFDDTIRLGSHYNVMELEARTTVHWDYELQGDHSWLSNWRDRKNPATTYELGIRSRLLADVEMNHDTHTRECDVIFKYEVDGSPVQQKVKLIQLGYNGLKSDSLALLEFARQNANQMSGLNVAWDLAAPITAWGNISIKQVNNGENRVTALQLSGVWLCYELTACISNLTELRKIDLSKNYLDGSLPVEMGRLVNLEELNVSENYSDNPDETSSYKISGIEEIPEEVFEGCTSLRVLNLNMNRLRILPNSIGKLTNLETLELGGENELTQIPDSEIFKSLKQLKNLYLADWKSWKGDFFDFIFDLTELQNLTIFRINFNESQELGDHFDRLPNLTSFTCQFTNLGGEIPASILKCKELKSLMLGQSKFTGDLLMELPDLEKLQTIDLSENLFTGEIPASYAKFGMNLGENSPRGTYTNLFLFGNCLTGEIPSAMLTCPMWSSAGLCWEPQTFICPQQSGYGFTNCK